MASKESSSGMMARTRHDAIVEFLEGERVPYELLEHEPAMTAVAEARVAGRSPDEVAKTVVLHDGRACVIAAIPAGYRLDVHKLRALLGASRRLHSPARSRSPGISPLSRWGRFRRSDRWCQLRR